MQLLKEHSTHSKESEGHIWDGLFFKDMLAAVLEAEDGQIIREEFATKYLREYQDIRVYTAMWFSYAKLTYCPFSCRCD